VDPCATRARAALVLDDEHRGAFADHQPVAAAVERAAGVDLVARRRRAEPAHPPEPERVDHRVGGTAQHDRGCAALDQRRSVGDRERSRGTRRDPHDGGTTQRQQVADRTRREIDPRPKPDIRNGASRVTAMRQRLARGELAIPANLTRPTAIGRGEDRAEVVEERLFEPECDHERGIPLGVTAARTAPRLRSGEQREPDLAIAQGARLREPTDRRVADLRRCSQTVVEAAREPRWIDRRDRDLARDARRKRRGVE
jgi:hypothetical protein